MSKTYVYIVVAARMGDGFTEDWVAGTFFNKDRAQDCLRQLCAKPGACDQAYVIEEEVLDAQIGVS